MVGEEFFIEKTPAVLYKKRAIKNAEKSGKNQNLKKGGKVFLVVHGQGGNKEEAADFCERQKLRDRKERHADQFQTVTIDEGAKPRGAKERYRVCFGAKYVLHVAWLSNFL